MGRHAEALSSIAAEFGITIVSTSRRRRPGETHAAGALEEILRDHGADHLRQVMRLVRETGPNREGLWSEVFAAVSDVLVSISAWKDRQPELFEALNTIHLEKVREKAVSLRPWPVRGSLRVLLWIALEERLGPAA